jgi:putative heme iron utilization protein
MSTRLETPEPGNDLERLIVELFGLEHTIFTVTSGDNLAIAELMGRGSPYFGHGWWKVETSGFHIHAQVGAVKRVRFLRQPSDHVPGQESLSIWLVGPNGESLLRCYLTQLYRNETEPIAERFAVWEDLRARYGAGRDEVAVSDGAMAAPAAAGAAT